MLAGGGMLASGAVGTARWSSPRQARRAPLPALGPRSRRWNRRCRPSQFAVWVGRWVQRRHEAPARSSFKNRVESDVGDIRIGSQPLAGSGFENERAAKGSAATAAVSSPDSMAGRGDRF
jgi:hypothetical protein